MKNPNLLFLPILILIILIWIYGVLLSIGFATRQESGVADVPCYDRYSNEIENVTCECIVYDYGRLNWMMEEQCGG